MKDALHILLMAAIGAVVLFGGVPLELYFVDLKPPTLPADLTLEEWKASFQKYARYITLAAVAASMLWYIVARCAKVNEIKDAGKQGRWFLLALIPFFAFIAGALLLEKAESSLGLYLAYIYFFVNAFVCYYVATLFLSPASFKYTPAWASAVRRWW